MPQSVTLSAGPDGLPSLLFKRLRNSLVSPLTIVFNQLLSVAAIPEDWKKARFEKKVHQDKLEIILQSH